ncbi:kazal-type serine protease inhibitor domain-containing protein 1-like isoform X2 [Poeciliopsis prolifica]|uniref:kazal-type serine protease inhibitor domain-containing protein 1-like isoform X2 n=1 Tax=Poeciliopsis prolifica TaxID=188132 RepID=UPI002413372E|nr:kazal-type serine protease inhibitor domain-containing protein 1-like isoform X2 [Poeciliopsis prolifica]
MPVLLVLVLILDPLSCRGAPPVRSSIPDPVLYLDLLEEPGGGNGTGLGPCGPCDPELCPELRGCPAGLVPDRCGCCAECGNLEGQACDPGARARFYGLCGTGLRCQADRVAGQGGDDEEEEEEVCVCEQQGALCGSDGTTYLNLCRFREAAFSDPELRTAGTGPCRTAPVIKVGPQDQLNGSGSIMLFLCEVFAFPMALVEWRKDGRDVVLPGDDPHISVQTRGGPLRFELSSWLQIEGAEPGDSGTYRCIARNELGSVSASAVLGVLGAGETQLGGGELILSNLSFLSVRPEEPSSGRKQLLDDL